MKQIFNSNWSFMLKICITKRAKKTYYDPDIRSYVRTWNTVLSLQYSNLLLVPCLKERMPWVSQAPCNLEEEQSPPHSRFQWYLLHEKVLIQWYLCSISCCYMPPWCYLLLSNKRSSSTLSPSCMGRTKDILEGWHSLRGRLPNAYRVSAYRQWHYSHLPYHITFFTTIIDLFLLGRVSWAMPKLIPVNYSYKTLALITPVATIIVDTWNWTLSRWDIPPHPPDPESQPLHHNTCGYKKWLLVSVLNPVSAYRVRVFPSLTA